MLFVQLALKESGCSHTREDRFKGKTAAAREADTHAADTRAAS
jgi:hypothetical protein